MTQKSDFYGKIVFRRKARSKNNMIPPVGTCVLQIVSELLPLCYPNKSCSLRKWLGHLLNVRFKFRGPLNSKLREAGSHWSSL